MNNQYLKGTGGVISIEVTLPMYNGILKPLPDKDILVIVSLKQNYF